jgi:diguanylate cyclase (GGDEF)-like protein
MVAERLRQNIEQLQIHYDNIVVGVTMSFGVATWENVENTFDKFIKQVDEYLYSAKEKGRNKIIAS